MKTTLFFLLPATVAASEDSDVPLWEIALAAGSGGLALLLLVYALFQCRRPGPKALETVVVGKPAAVTANGKKPATSAKPAVETAKKPATSAKPAAETANGKKPAASAKPAGVVDGAMTAVTGALSSATNKMTGMASNVASSVVGSKPPEPPAPPTKPVMRAGGRV